MNESRKPMLCIGIGNPFRGDDAAGLHVARWLLKAQLPNLRVLEASGEGAQLMRLWAGYDSVVLVDAAQSGVKSGTLHRFEASMCSLPTRFFSYSTHAFSVAEAIEMARVLGKLPEQMTVFGIEGKDFSFQQCLSPEVDAAISVVVREIKRMVTVPAV